VIIRVSRVVLEAQLPVLTAIGGVIKADVLRTGPNTLVGEDVTLVGV